MPRRGENIRKRKDNRWEGRYINYYDSSGKAKYRSVYGKTYYEVKKKLNDANKQNTVNMLSDKNQKITFKDAFYLWLDRIRINLKDQTYAKYLFLAQTHLIPDIGSINVKKMNCYSINVYLSYKRNKGRVDGNGGLSTSYVQSLCFIIRAVMKYAVNEGYCSFLVGNIYNPGKKKHSLEVLSVQEQDALVRYSTTGIQNDIKLGILLSLYTGMRIGEVCGLMWSDIDFNNKTIHVCHTVERIKNLEAQPNENKTKLILGDAKTYSSD